MNRRILHYIAIIFIWMNFSIHIGYSQENSILDNYKGFADPSHSLWLGTYMNFRITERLFWAGEFHYRRTEYEGVKYIGRIAQIYNRHGIKYVHSKNFSATAGGVLRLNFTPKPGDDTFNKIVLEPRIWHEYLFAMPFNRFMVYHRLRFEHRWLKSNKIGATFDHRTRYRYKFLMKIPLNNRQLGPKTFYLSPDVELIMQSGSSAPFEPMEDLRLYPHIGYQYNPRIGGSLGMMYTTGQQMSIGDFNYRKRWVMRFNLYISLDFRKFEDKIPTVNIAD